MRTAFITFHKKFRLLAVLSLILSLATSNAESVDSFVERAQLILTARVDAFTDCFCAAAEITKEGKPAKQYFRQRIQISPIQSLLIPNNQTPPSTIIVTRLYEATAEESLGVQPLKARPKLSTLEPVEVGKTYIFLLRSSHAVEALTKLEGMPATTTGGWSVLDEHSVLLATEKNIAEITRKISDSRLNAGGVAKAEGANR